MNTENSQKGFGRPKYRDLLICVFLVSATLAVYWPLKGYDYVDYDDNQYVSENPQVLNGLTLEGIIWAFTTRQSSNWHPLTWISHMVDIELFGANPGRQHLENLFWHLLNTLLLFAVFRKMTGNSWQSGTVAAIFALHPLHVESVAWIAERKDVLSTFFAILALWAYDRYAVRPSIGRYSLIFLFLSLGLMSKPMLVTLPFVMLLLDYWPLGRFAGAAAIRIDGSRHDRQPILGLVIEKGPLFALVAVSSIITFWIQQQSGALRPVDALPVGVRIANALLSYVIYIEKTFWPVDLAVLYPYPTSINPLAVVGAVILLAAMTVLAVRMIRQRPYVAVGWFWYLGTLVPVIGLVQVGIQARADRYTYFPLIGIAIILAWSGAEVMAKLQRFKKALLTFPAAALVLMIALAARQVHYWKDAITLFEHTQAVTVENWLAHYNLGFALELRGQTESAASHYQETVRIKPDYEPAHTNLGIVLDKLGRTREAIAQYREALRINPDYAKAHNNLGIALEKIGQTQEAVAHYREALRIDPGYEKAHNNLGLALEELGQVQEAVSHYREALRIRPGYERAHYNLANALHRQGLLDEAIVHYLDAIHTDPDFEAAHNNLGIALYQKGNIDGAIGEFREALRINPNSVNAKTNLMRLLEIKRQQPS